MNRFNVKTTPFFLYLFIALIPAILIAVFIIQQNLHIVKGNNIKEANEHLSLHKSRIDSFIHDTVTTLDAIGMVINTKREEQYEIQEVLIQMEEKDARFSGLYWVNTDGILEYSSSPPFETISIAERDYFQKAKETKTTTFSSGFKGRLTGLYIVTICTPVLDPTSDEVVGYILAGLNLYYMGQSLSELVSEQLIIVKDHKDQILFLTSVDSPVDSVMISSSLQNVDWTIEAHSLPASTSDVIYSSLPAMFATFILSHVIYLAFLSFFLRRKSIQEKRKQEKQKLQLIGQLAASTAHEIRNPLTGIKGLVTLLSEKHFDKEDQYYFSIIQDEITRINLIVSEFLVLGKPTADKHELHNLSEIVLELKPLIESEAHLHNAQLNVNITQDVIHLFCVKDQLKQIILNLCRNSFEAMQTQGTLHIDVLKQKKEALLIFKDNGVGISDVALKKVFDPFFTNKEMGTGLGLVICKRIVEYHNGTITIDSKEGQGTFVTISLPLAN
ncbi:ATP-binding protein [Bacillus alkalisoli]|uniref:ATP-binding protein n=1 Tax=Bacillus alkalisoli TaxID=2011008 RepID=UPI0018E21399|nr:ATP-binding protein [Bacillus alkalisoli]